MQPRTQASVLLFVIRQYYGRIIRTFTIQYAYLWSSFDKCMYFVISGIYLFDIFRRFSQKIRVQLICTHTVFADFARKEPANIRVRLTMVTIRCLLKNVQFINKYYEFLTLNLSV